MSQTSPIQKIFVKVLSLVVLLTLVFGSYFFIARPAQLNWGATAAEIARPMAGDELDPTPTFLATRAITINATPEQIYPWLVQIGFCRAGFYGYDILESAGCPQGFKSADRILPEFQNFKVGDDVPISVASREVFYAIQPAQSVIWAGTSGGHPGGFIWALYPAGPGQTRLVSRIRWTHHSLSDPRMFSLDAITEFMDHVAVRKVLQGVKDRAEGQIEPAWIANAEFTVFVISALIFCAAFIVLALQSLNARRWGAVLAAGFIWLVTWYAPVPFWAGALLEIALLCGLVWAFRKA